MNGIVFLDSEINHNGEICDLDAVKPDGSKLHTSSHNEFSAFVSDCNYICGHNLIAYDVKYISHLIPGEHVLMDTLTVSPLLFLKKPYHHLLKDYKIQTEQLNDAALCMDLFFDEVEAFNPLDERLKAIFFSLPGTKRVYLGFFDYVECVSSANAESLIREFFRAYLRQRRCGGFDFPLTRGACILPCPNQRRRQRFAYPALGSPEFPGS